MGILRSPQYSEDELLAHIARQTHLKVLKPRMLSGPLQGKFLEMMVKISGARKVLEIGTFTGYATICMARGLPEKGKIITLDINRELEPMVRDFFALGFGRQNRLPIGKCPGSVG